MRRVVFGVSSPQSPRHTSSIAGGHPIAVEKRKKRLQPAGDCSWNLRRLEAEMASASEVDEFVRSALITWVRIRSKYVIQWNQYNVFAELIAQVESCLPNPEELSGYPALTDGMLLHKIWLQIDPEPQHHPVKLEHDEDVSLGHARTRNIDVIVKNIKNLYEEELGQTLLVLPDCSIIGNAPGKQY